MRYGLLELELELHPHWRLQMTAVKWGRCRALGTSQLSICGAYHICSSLNSFTNTMITAWLGNEIYRIIHGAFSLSTVVSASYIPSSYVMTCSDISLTTGLDDYSKHLIWELDP